MKFVTFILSSLVIMLTSVGCTEQKDALKPWSSDIVYETSLRANGTAFYGMDNNSGQLYFMLDYGDMRGQWQKFGEPLRVSGPNPLLFDVLERAGATTFYALDGRTGQLYYANDDEATQGKWNSYGNLVRENAINLLQFEAQGRFEGNSFYAFDSYEGQMYFMNDFGDNAGQWREYGGTLNK